MRGLIAVLVALSLASCASLRKSRAEQAEQVEVVRNERLAAQMESIADATTIEKVIELYVETADSAGPPKRMKVVRRISSVEKHRQHRQQAEMADSGRVTVAKTKEVTEKRKKRKGGNWMILGLITFLVIIIGYKLKNEKHN